MKILFISLGCDKNLADSEEMLGLLTGNGHEIVDSEEEADAIVINTCCFIHDAKEESVNTILEMAEYKKTGTCKILIVTGCMAQRYKEEITEEIPEVDAVLGTTSYGDIVKALNEAEAGHVFRNSKILMLSRKIPVAESLQLVDISDILRLLKAVISIVPTVSFLR